MGRQYNFSLTPSGYPSLAHSSVKSLFCPQDVCKVSWKLVSEGKDSGAEAAEHRMPVQSRASYSCNGSRDAYTKLDNMGKHRIKIKTFPHPRCFSFGPYPLSGLEILASRFCTCHPSLWQEGKEPHTNSIFFSSRLVSPPQTHVATKSWFFSLSPPTTTTERQTLAVIYTSTHCCHNHLAARHQDMLFLLKVIFLTRSLPGQGWLSGLGAGVFLP